MSINRDIVYTEIRHDVMVGRAKTVTSKLIDAHTEMKLLLEDLIVVVDPTQAVPPATAKSGLNLPKLPLILLTVLIASCTLGANYGGPNMASLATKPSDAGALLNAARKAMQEKNWSNACFLFEGAKSAGANAELTLGRMAECDFYAHDYKSALRTCEELESETKGASAVPAYIRGLIALEEGDHLAAVQQLKTAEMAGHPYAKVALQRVK